jgi:casein kinase II subunit alpha
MFKKHPMFKGKENDDVLDSIVRTLGTDDMWAYMQKYNLAMPDRLMNVTNVT